MAWCEKVKSLLNGISISSSMHYVARAYAPFTYAQILNMAMSINVPMPLIFLADKNQYHSSKTVEAIELSGGFYALVFNQSLIAKRSEEQLQALVARELARIGQMRTKNYAVFYRAAQYAVAGVCCASAYTFFSAEWMKTHGLTLALIAGGCIASLVVAK